MTLSNDHIIAGVTRPERPKGAKDEVKSPEGPPTGSQGPGGPHTSSFVLFTQDKYCVKLNYYPEEKSL